MEFNDAEDADTVDDMISRSVKHQTTAMTTVLGRTMTLLNRKL